MLLVVCCLLCALGWCVDCGAWLLVCDCVGYVVGVVVWCCFVGSLVVVFGCCSVHRMSHGLFLFCVCLWLHWFASLSCLVVV